MYMQNVHAELAGQIKKLYKMVLEADTTVLRYATLDCL
jgi:hypothetical protein